MSITSTYLLRQLEFSLELIKFKNNHSHDPNAIRGLVSAYLSSVDEMIDPDHEGFNDYIFTKKGRSERKFHTECARLNENACAFLALSLLKGVRVSTKHEMATSEEAKNAVIEYFCDLAFNDVYDEVQKIDRPGDKFCIWTYLNANCKDLQEYVIKKEADGAVTPFEEMCGSIAIMGLVMQANELYSMGHIEKAWLCLIDASYHSGAQEGARIMRRLAPAAERRKQAIAHAMRRHESTDLLKERTIEIYNEKKRAAHWANAKQACNEIHPIIFNEAKDLSDQLEKEGKSRVTLGYSAVLKLIRDLMKVEKEARKEHASQGIS